MIQPDGDLMDAKVFANRIECLKGTGTSVRYDTAPSLLRKLPKDCFDYERIYKLLCNFGEQKVWSVALYCEDAAEWVFITVSLELDAAVTEAIEERRAYFTAKAARIAARI